MVTDSQYKELEKRVEELEKKLNYMSQQFSRLMFLGDKPSDPVRISVESKKDTTKYLLDNKLYCKRRVAYECVRKYVDENDIKTYDEIIKVFPDHLQGSLGVIKPIEMAEKYSNAHRRFYFSDEDILLFDDKRYVVCSQWEKKNISKLLKVASDLGYQIQAVSIN